MSEPATLPPGSPGTESLPEGEVKMTIWEHLGELRSRVIRAGLAVLLTTIVAWVYHERILQWLEYPYEVAWRAHQLPGPPDLTNIATGGAFAGYLQLSLRAGIVAAAPIVFYQLWSFISPGLYTKEKRLIVPFVLFSSTLFLSGIAFGYYLALPITLNYLFSLLGPIGPSGAVLTQHTTLHEYLDFSTRLLLGCGGMFELPLFIAFLAIAGIVTPQQLLKFGRWAILASFIIGAAISPGPDVSSQIVMSLPLILLYFLSVGIAYLVAKKRTEGGA